MQVLDIDGDGRADLLLVNLDSATPFRFRLQRHDGQLGPEVYFKLPPIHSYWGDNLEAGKQTFIVTVAQFRARANLPIHPQTGRVAFRANSSRDNSRCCRSARPTRRSAVRNGRM